MNEKPSYWAIIPANVRYDNELCCNEKIMYSEISALQNVNGYCHASNNYFAELYQVERKTVSRWINKLIKKRYLKSKLIYKPGTKQVDKRLLYISVDPIHFKEDTLSTLKETGYSSNSGDPIHKIVEDNSTSINTITTTTPYREITRNEAKQIFLNYFKNDKEFLYEFDRFKIENALDPELPNSKGTRTIKNWKRWCLQLRKFNKQWGKYL